MIAPQLPVIDLAPRQCGPCTACCKQLPIPAGIVSAEAKPKRVPCPHLCTAGCAVYARRPQVCVDFRCAWLKQSTWPARWRPHQSGLLCLLEAVSEGALVAVYELRRGALASPTGQAIVEQLLSQSLAVALIDFAEQRQTLLPAR